ncbi:hypothetical protein [Hymenobacter translucens]|uniref:hypothetical protein n=1 Tax=Hymenobacter translucens TaxID=2886507 RepID=UPI001D0E5ABF|nr:hypothetical protein [Hymenobacter translucens]
MPGIVLLFGWATGIVLLYQLLVAVHEGGHVAGALLARFQILTFSAGWLRLTRQAGGWKARFQRPEKGLGGMVQALAPDARNLRGRYSLFVAGGPAATLLTGAAALCLGQKLLGHYGPEYAVQLSAYLLVNALRAFGWLSLIVGGLNLIPMVSKSGYSLDGKHLWELLRGGPAMHQTLGMLQLQTLSYAGIRPRDWDPALLQHLLSNSSGGQLDCYGHYYAYAYYYDRNELELIREHLNEALDRRHLTPVTMQQHVLCEAASVAALLTRNTEQARYWLDKAQQAKPFTKEEGLFARAAVAYAEGHLQEAEKWLIAVRKQVDELPEASMRSLSTERLNEFADLLRQANEQLQTA